MRANPSRRGFLILIMIAFSSILLGLATTFFIYCSKSLDSSGEAVRYAQSRIALHGALAYTMNAIRTQPNTSNLSAAIINYSSAISYSTLLNAGCFTFDNAANPRTKKGGFMRISAVPDALNTTSFDTLNPVGTPIASQRSVSVYLTVGSGPSGGDLNVASSPVTPLEFRRCYKFEIFILNAAATYSCTLTPMTTPLTALY